MAKSNLIVAVDIGSGKMTAIAATQNVETNMLEVVSGKVILCNGLNGGVVCDITDTSASAHALIDSLSRDCNDEPIEQIFLAIRGEHLETYTNDGSYHISRPDKEVTRSDMDMAIENAKAIAMRNNYQIVSVSPQEYFINNQRGIRNPEGMEASVLKVKVQIVTGSVTHLKNLDKAIELHGYDGKNKEYGLLALGEAVLSQDEKENGVVLIDFGAETTSVGVYINGGLKYSHDFPFGCDEITNDLSRYFHTPRKAAQFIKEKYGVTHPSLIKPEQITIPLMDGYKTREISTESVAQCIQPCVEELLETIERGISEAGFDLTKIPFVGVITGGGSLMPGMDLQCAHIFGFKEVRRGCVPRDAVQANNEFFEPQYTTALALAVYVSKSTEYARYYVAKSEGSIWGTLVGWIKKVIGY